VYAAIDFGISNTDIVWTDGQSIGRRVQPHDGIPSVDSVRQLLSATGLEWARLQGLAVTGGQHRVLPSTIDGVPVRGVGELESIGRGGQALVGLSGPGLETPILVVSAGSGTAIVAAQGNVYRHVTGTGVGGGTMVGLARLLLSTTDPHEIDRLSLAGDANGADLSLADVVTGPIGRLPPDATAVNFGRVARLAALPNRHDLAAALVTMVGQVIGTLAVVAARGQQMERVVVIGHLIDMKSMRRAISRVGEFYGLPFELPEEAGHATALGALLVAYDMGS
jgi:type II pantothenate kinase